MKVQSPITGLNNTEKIDSISSCQIIEKFQEDFNLDINDYFNSIDSVDIYKCKDSSLRFYHPRTLEGDSQLYMNLQDKTKYYASWRWDHEKASSFLNSYTDKNILEIGPGSGTFLKFLQEKGNTCVGLELNPNSIQNNELNSYDIRIESILDHVPQNKNKYDVVCSFQVMEHVSEIKDIIEASVQILKPGGKLLFSVPNNNPFLYRFDKLNTLNLPPHHLNLWDEESLMKLSKFFQLKIIDIVTEPLNYVQHKEYFNVQKNYLDLKKSFTTKIPFLFKLVYLPYLKVATQLKFIKGRNLLAIYEKI